MAAEPSMNLTNKVMQLAVRAFRNLDDHLLALSRTERTLFDTPLKSKHSFYSYHKKVLQLQEILATGPSSFYSKITSCNNHNNLDSIWLIYLDFVTLHGLTPVVC